MSINFYNPLIFGHLLDPWKWSSGDGTPLLKSLTYPKSTGRPMTAVSRKSHSGLAQLI
ncbi:hypothetical protein [Synechocystis sp. LKSZ1]|uniref:hypothetical protein n=1 Tax=Synechocystis sp. LKSZ1 TaxID=3144951 RepID=UPI00336C01E5